MHVARYPIIVLILAALLAATPTPPPVAGVAPLTVTVAEMHLVALGYRATKIIGSSVTNDKNQNIGKVVDFVVTPTDYVSFIIVNVGAFLGIIGGKNVAVPAKRFKGLGTGKIVLPGATKQALQALPPFIPAQ
ncbi:MAG TPA: PRC-barrel domain-containing protein [Candidatus Baltobacteraceae bacterium]|nr:PRC-barrel domain-containing protein [Candidatus Baltobacteraceae bacterium]